MLFETDDSYESEILNMEESVSDCGLCLFSGDHGKYCRTQCGIPGYDWNNAEKEYHLLRMGDRVRG